MSHPALTSPGTAVITGGAAGIGLAAGVEFARRGMRVAIADIRESLFEAAEQRLRAAGAPDVLTRATDVSDFAAMQALEAAVTARFGGADIVMNNAGTQGSTSIVGPRETWQQILGVNLWGVINGTQAFLPGMIARGRAGAIINTGSKQGITTPPGNPAYNVSKSGVKSFTEALAHELRNTADARVTAHLLIPGFVFTDLTRRGRTAKPDDAWTPEQTAAFMIERFEAGDFYILCPDNDVTREIDQKRMAWAMGDVIENRPALSRWHPDYADAFAAYMDDE